MAETTVPVLNEEEVKKLGVRLTGLFKIHESDRKAAEQRWLQNLRQFRGIYDPEVLRMIPAGYSKAYPKLTRWKVIGTIARLMQMLFPQTEKNYGIKNSPIPDLPVEQLQEVLNTLMAAKAGEGGDPLAVELTDDEIEKAIVAVAADKAERMEKKIDDDLQEMEYITLARKVVFSAVLYNVGVLKGPYHIKVKARTWEKDPNRGGYIAKEVDRYKPMFDFLPVWAWYPDMSAKALAHQDMTFERHVMTRAQVEKLADRPDFLKASILEWLRTHASGNHQSRDWEEVLRSEKKSDKSQIADMASRKYELISGRGDVTGHELRACGVTISDADVGRTFKADVWLIDSTVIKARLAPLGDDSRMYHEFVFEEDDLSLLGNGQVDTLRDSQISLCEVTRAAQDNAAVIGPMVEVNTDLLVSGHDTSIRKHKTWLREGSGNDANYPAVRDISVNSHLPDLMQLRSSIMDFADKESGLPPPSLGDVSGGGSEALRTQQNASMFLGAAALPIRDTVRNFDTFTISVITSLVKWNAKYDPNPARDGDFDIIARGSTSLIAKEVLSQSLDVFRATVTPDEAPHIKTRALLAARARSRDIPIDDILETEDEAKRKINQQQQVQAQQLADQRTLVQAQVRETLAKAFKAVADAHKADASISIDALTVLLEALNGGEQAGEAGQGKGSSRPAK